MSPAEFAEVVVLPTIRDFFAAPVNRRLAYLSCIATYALADYVARAEDPDALPKGEVLKILRAACGPRFDVVQGVCNGAKHAKGRTNFMLGEEFVEPAIGFGEAQELVNGQPTIGGFGQAAFGVPRLYIVESGTRYTIDVCVRAVLLAFVERYPKHLGSVDVTWMHPRAPRGV